MFIRRNPIAHNNMILPSKRIEKTKTNTLAMFKKATLLFLLIWRMPKIDAKIMPFILNPRSLTLHIMIKILMKIVQYCIKLILTWKDNIVHKSYPPEVNNVTNDLLLGKIQIRTSTIFIKRQNTTFPPSFTLF